MPKDRQITRSQEAKHSGNFVEAKSLQAETQKAIGLPHKTKDQPIWLPKSQIDAMEAEDGRVFCYIPQWLCRKKEIEMVVKY